ncbi:MAG: glycosyltransferase family 2 protein [Chitinophagaceae bacterium]|nr:glycosyltransferase family 2 protein [Chitinophagaceae bacterium]
MVNYPSVAVVILNWNGQKYLEQFLPFLVNTTYPNVQFIVADNGSTDNSLAFLTENYPEIRLLRHPVNEGFANGYNKALQQVAADYYVLLNSDVEVTPGWIEPVIALMEKDPVIGACQPKVLSWHDKKCFEYAGAAGGWIDAYGYPFCRGRIFDVCEEDHGQYNNAAPIFWASGCAFFVRPEVFHQLHGFDGFFFAHQEEIDLCWRMQSAGHQVFVCPSSVVYHVGGGSLPKGNPRKIYLNHRNSLIMLFRNYPPGERTWKIPLRLVLDGLSGFQQMIKGNRDYLWMVLKAHFSFYRWLIAAKDKRYFPKNRHSILQGMYRGSIVWQYFVKNKKRFSEIIGRNS